MAINKKFNIEAVNDYPPIRFDVRFERKYPIRRSLVSVSVGHLDHVLIVYSSMEHVT